MFLDLDVWVEATKQYGSLVAQACAVASLTGSDSNKDLRFSLKTSFLANIADYQRRFPNELVKRLEPYLVDLASRMSR